MSDARSVMVSAAVAPLVSEPSAGSEQLSQQTYGHTVAIEEERGPWLRVRCADGYIGWMHRGFVRARDELPGSLDRISLGCMAREPGGRRLSVPIGGLLAEGVMIESGEALQLSVLPRRFPRQADAVVRSAVAMFEGTRYEWGGVTPWGADCSGMVQTIYGLHGVRLPRDSHEQATQGEEAGTDAMALRAADLLFFTDRDDGRITHVAVALGEMRIVHLALGRGGYAVENLRDGSDPYVGALLRRFRFARRLNLG